MSRTGHHLVPEIGLTPQLVRRFEGLGVDTAVYHSALTETQRYQVWKKTREGEVKIVVNDIQVCML